MVSQYPAIVEEPVPANHLLSALGSRWFQIAFQVVLFGTLIETGTGMIHAVNERLAEARRAAGRRLPAWGRPATATVLLGVALALTPLGLVDLIARGYGTITWGFVLLYVVPVLTVGLWKIRVADRGRAVVAGAGASGA